jgi:hypothetical protein
MNQITIIHNPENLNDIKFDNFNIFIGYEDIDYNVIMEKVVKDCITNSNKSYAIYTDFNYCDYISPCGCSGYDEPCDWHRGYDNADFAPCLCSKKYEIKCEYHRF